jgi:hypothetical protein
VLGMPTEIEPGRRAGQRPTVGQRRRGGRRCLTTAVAGRGPGGTAATQHERERYRRRQQSADAHRHFSPVCIRLL